jgi:hypothetical protein
MATATKPKQVVHKVAIRGTQVKLDNTGLPNEGKDVKLGPASIKERGPVQEIVLHATYDDQEYACYFTIRGKRVGYFTV